MIMVECKVGYVINVFMFLFQNLYAPDPDPNMTVEEYKRTSDQNEELGLNDMKTENYETS